MLCSIGKPINLVLNGTQMHFWINSFLNNSMFPFFVTLWITMILSTFEDIGFLKSSSLPPLLISMFLLFNKNQLYFCLGETQLSFFLILIPPAKDVSLILFASWSTSFWQISLKFASHFQKERRNTIQWAD